MCKTCGKPMVGWFGDDECSDCAFPALKQASEAACRAVEEHHFTETGQRKTAGALLRQAMGIVDRYPDIPVTVADTDKIADQVSPFLAPADYLDHPLLESPVKPHSSPATAS